MVIQVSLNTRCIPVRMVRPKNQNHKNRNTFLAHVMGDVMILSKNKATTRLFVDNVEGENTEAVELLLAGSRAHRVERATVSSFQ